ncbi:MAG: hypothetical protein R3E53_13520 [Myxococcota bacterium]
MSVGARFDGHIVQGHVDGVGRVRRFEREGNEARLHVECDPELAGQLVDKGSVTIDGVSLTVVEVVRDGFHVALIPHTLEVTTLSDLVVGDRVNLEVDVFGKYVKQYLDRVLPGPWRRRAGRGRSGWIGRSGGRRERAGADRGLSGGLARLGSSCPRARCDRVGATARAASDDSEARRWQRTLDRVAPAVVVLRVSTPRAFDDLTPAPRLRRASSWMRSAASS